MTRSLDDEDEPPLDPAQVRVVQRLRRLMLLSSLIMACGFLLVFGVIAYRLSTGGESERPTGSGTVQIPHGARVLSTAVAGGRIVVTVEVGGGVEIRTFDLETLAPRGELRFAPAP